MLRCDLRVRWKAATDLRFRAAISESETPSFCRISGDLASSMRKLLAIAIMRFWCAKCCDDLTCMHEHLDQARVAAPCLLCRRETLSSPGSSRENKRMGMGRQHSTLLSMPQPSYGRARRMNGRWSGKKDQGGGVAKPKAHTNASFPRSDVSWANTETMAQCLKHTPNRVNWGWGWANLIVANCCTRGFFITPIISWAILASTSVSCVGSSPRISGSRMGAWTRCL